MNMNGEPDIARTINACDEKCSREGLAALSSTERTVCLVNWLRFEVTLGGLSTFYYNSASDHAPAMVWALNQIGAPRAAEALSEANAVLQGGAEMWPDSEARFHAMKRVGEARWRELEAKLCSDSPRSYEGLLDDFVVQNAGQLLAFVPHQ